MEKHNNNIITNCSDVSSDSTKLTFSREVDKINENTDSCNDLEGGKLSEKSESSALVQGSKQADNTYRNFGKTFPMWFNGFEPRIVIGPHCKKL